MYVCGVTVDDSSHQSCAFVFSFRYHLPLSEIFGLPSAVCAQFHRVDNKIIKRANDENVSWDKITERYIDEFYRDSASDRSNSRASSSG